MVEVIVFQNRQSGSSLLFPNIKFETFGEIGYILLNSNFVVPTNLKLVQITQ